ncbi:MAG: acyltransferase family protein [Prevotella koreensis]|uniref:acyltransferase family protein n=1 Tax=Prevotella koreensis TaxID=2490854 RepID=UPI003F9EFBE9
MKSRLHYVDILKGIGILFVLLHHVPFIMGYVNNPYIDNYCFKNFYLPFFMPAFFFMTGYCSSFNAPFRIFLIKNLKTILLPCFCLYYINRYFVSFNQYLFSENSSNWLTFSNIIAPGFRTFIREGGFYWFLSALFIGKLFFWICNRFLHSFQSSVIAMLGISLLGVVLYGIIPSFNYFYVFNGMTLSIFIYLGFVLKNYTYYNVCKHVSSSPKYTSLLKKTVVFLYISSGIAVSLLGYEAPNVTRTLNVTPSSYILYLLMSISGLGVFIMISRSINSNILLEYIGRGSLVFYAFNIQALTFFSCSALMLHTPATDMELLLMSVCVVVLSLLLLGVIYYVLSKKYFRFIFGQF